MTYEQTIMEHEEMAFQQGMQQGMEKGIVQANLASLKAVMKNLNLSAEDAMDVLDIPKEDYLEYKKLLQTF